MNLRAVVVAVLALGTLMVAAILSPQGSVSAHATQPNMRTTFDTSMTHRYDSSTKSTGGGPQHGPMAGPVKARNGIIIGSGSQFLAAEGAGGSEVLLDTSAVKAQAAARGLMQPGECAVICSTVAREAAEQGFSTGGLPVIADGTSAVLRGQVAMQLRMFGASSRGLEGDATIGATALERGIPLITGDRALWNAVIKLGGDARWFAPGG